MKKIDFVYDSLVKIYMKKNEGVSAEQISEALKIQRSNASAYLNMLCSRGKATKINTRPVIFKPNILNINDADGFNDKTEDVFYTIIGKNDSLKTSIEQAKAAILYPPNGLNTIIIGETGVGKSMLAELMYKFAVETNVLPKDAPFITFNCADYANNPQLLIGQLFGIEKGAYTGADKDKIGLFQKADGGILFLDEIHRLPPEGQEMLFTYMDKGFFRRLGNTNNEISVKVRIIAATTENPQSSLLDTFNRRIPMTIMLPSIGERSLKERFEFINYFFSQESKRIGKNIYVENEALEALLLYSCKNNIGQLKSDIQLACARGFFDYIDQNKTEIKVNIKYFDNRVRDGLLNIKENREEVNELLKVTGKYMLISYKNKINISDKNNLYSNIEKRFNDLKNQGMNKEKLNQIIDNDIKIYFNKYIGKFNDDINESEIVDIVGEDINKLVNSISDYIKKELGMQLSRQVFVGLCMHIKSTIQKLKEHREIVYPNFNEVRLKFSDEFKVATKIVQMIENYFGLQLPIDEIGLITLLLVSHNFEGIATNESKRVKVLVVLHGNSTASSMANVVNELLQVNFVKAIDMPLNMSTKEAYMRTKKMIEKIDEGRGVLLLVDMGSLTRFGEMVEKEIGINVKTVEMVSTPMILEAAQKALILLNLDEVYNFTVEVNPYIGKKIHSNNAADIKSNLILTSCFTGEYTAVKLKSTICKNIDLKAYNTEVMTISINNRDEYVQTVLNLKKQRNIIALIGTLDPKIDDIRFIRSEKLLTPKGIQKLGDIIKSENMYCEIARSLNGHLINLDSSEIVKDIRKSIGNIICNFNMEQKEDSQIGWILHISFMMDQLISGDRCIKLNNKDIIKKRYIGQYRVVKNQIDLLGDKYNVSIPDEEICALIIIIFEISDI